MFKPLTIILNPIQCILIAVVVFFLGRTMGFAKSDGRWEAIEATFMGDEATTTACSAVWSDAKKNPDYELIREPDDRNSEF